MKPSGVITITTDFGHKGPFAGVMKGVILSRFADAKVVDLAHDIPAQWPPEAGFWVSRSYAWFPHGTVHLAIVDPGVGTERDILIAEVDGHVFIAPDNGLLGQLLDTAESSSSWSRAGRRPCDYLQPAPPSMAVTYSRRLRPRLRLAAYPPMNWATKWRPGRLAGSTSRRPLMAV